MDVIGIDVEAAEINVSGFGVLVKPHVDCFLDIAVDQATRLISVGVGLFVTTDEGEEKELSVSFEDHLPYYALPKRGEIGVELRDLLDPQRSLDQVVGMAIAGFLAVDAYLMITCDDAAPNERNVVELRLRVGELYEDAVERPYRELAPFLEAFASPPESEIVREMGLGLEPLPEKS